MVFTKISSLPLVWHMKSETAVAQNSHSLLWERHFFAVSMKQLEPFQSKFGIKLFEHRPYCKVENNT